MFFVGVSNIDHNRAIAHAGDAIKDRQQLRAARIAAHAGSLVPQDAGIVCEVGKECYTPAAMDRKSNLQLTKYRRQ